MEIEASMDMSKVHGRWSVLPDFVLIMILCWEISQVTFLLTCIQRRWTFIWHKAWGKDAADAGQISHLTALLAIGEIKFSISEVT